MELALSKNGLDALVKEETRLDRLLTERMSDVKLVELRKTRNVLRSFDARMPMDQRRDKDEL
jgi:hypothetical protein